MNEENIEWDLMYDLHCWHCKRFHAEHQCKGKPSHVVDCLNYEERKEEDDGRTQNVR